MSTADEVIVGEHGSKIVSLKGIDLLAPDKIDRVCTEQLRKQLPAIFPGIGAIVGQAEAKVEGHH